CQKARSLAHRGASSRDDPKGGACGGGSQPLAPGGPGSRRQALLPGCEELALRIRVMPETEARGRVKNRHGGAPRGERPASWDARRLASAWRARRRRARARLWARPAGVPPSTRTFLGAPPTPRFGVSEAKLQSPGAKMRRGNEIGCLKSE